MYSHDHSDRPDGRVYGGSHHRHKLRRLQDAHRISASQLARALAANLVMLRRAARNADGVPIGAAESCAAAALVCGGHLSRDRGCAARQAAAAVSSKDTPVGMYTVSVKVAAGNFNVVVPVNVMVEK